MGTVDDVSDRAGSLAEDPASPEATDQIKTFLNDFRDAMEAATEVAPEKMEADMVIMRDTITDAAAIAEKAETFEQVTRGLRELADPKVQAAGDRINGYVEGKCGFTLGTPSKRTGLSPTASAYSHHQTPGSGHAFL